MGYDNQKKIFDSLELQLIWVDLQQKQSNLEQKYLSSVKRTLSVSRTLKNYSQSNFAFSNRNFISYI